MNNIKIDVKEHENIVFTIINNSLSIKEYYNYSDKEKGKFKFNENNIRLDEITNIKYNNSVDEIKGKREQLVFFSVLAIVVLIIGIILSSAFDSTEGMIGTVILAFLIFLPGLYKKPNTVNSSFNFSISDNKQILYTKKVYLQEDTLASIINMIRDAQTNDKKENDE